MSARLISIMMPTLRRHLALQAINSMLTCGGGVEFEIILIAPFQITGDPRVVNVPEATPQGNIRAHVAGFPAARGDIVLTMSDDQLALPFWLIGLRELLEIKEKTYFPFAGGLNRPEANFFGTVYGLYYPYFPVMTRASIERIGGWFSGDYAAHFGDPDLGMRVWKHGGRCELLPGDRMTYNQTEDPASQAAHKHSSRERDMEVFMSKYHDEFGAGFKRDFRDINMDYWLRRPSAGSFAYRKPPTQLVEKGVVTQVLIGELS